MTSARVVLGKHSAWWGGMLPFSEDYARSINERLYSEAQFEAVGTINAAFFAEVVDRWCGYCLKCRGSRSLLESDPLPEEVVDQARSYVERFGVKRGLAVKDVDAVRDMALFTWDQLHEFAAGGRVLVRPVLPGLGVCSAVEADYIAGSALCEVKNVDRGLRSRDMRQVVLYLSLLRLAADLPRIAEVCFVNPRARVAWKVSVGAFLDGVAGSAATDVLDEVGDFLVGHGGYW